MSQQILFQQAEDSPPDTLTEFYEFDRLCNASTTEATISVPWPANGVLRNLVITLAVAPGAGNSLTFTVRLDGADTAMVVVISGTDVTGSYTAGNIAITAGGLIGLSVVPASTPAVGRFSMSVEFDSTTLGQSGYGFNDTKNSSAGVEYSGAFAGEVFVASDVLASDIAGASGNITAVYLGTSSNPGAGAGHTVAIVKNGVVQDGSGGTVDTRVAIINATSANGAFSLPVAAGDLISVQWTPSGSFSSRRWRMGVQFTASTPGHSHICGRGTTMSNTNTQYNQPTARGLVTFSWNTTEATDEVLTGLTNFTLSNLRLQLSGTPGSGNNYAFTLRQNQATPAGAPTVTIADLATTGSDLVGSIAFVSGNTVALQQVPSSAPTARTVIWSFLQNTSIAVITPPVGGGGGLVGGMVPADRRTFMVYPDNDRRLMVPRGRSRSFSVVPKVS